MIVIISKASTHKHVPTEIYIHRNAHTQKAVEGKAILKNYE